MSEETVRSRPCHPAKAAGEYREQMKEHCGEIDDCLVSAAADFFAEEESEQSSQKQSKENSERSNQNPRNHKRRRIRRKVTIIFFVIIFLASLFSTVLAAIIVEHALDVDVADLRPFDFLPLALRQIVFPISFILIAMIIFGSVSKKVVNPIVKLSDATKEVAAGNFDIQIEESMRHDEVGQLERNFNQMVRELHGNEYLRKDFIANVTHEFRTPLSVINGYAKLLEDESLDAAERQKYVRTIQSESVRLNDLTENILRISRLDSQKIQHSPTTFALDEQIRQSILLLERKWLAKNIEFDIDLAAVDFRGEEELLSHVWSNIIDNAIKYSNDGGTIKVRMGLPQDDMLCVEIADEGIGMSPITISRIFEQFYQEEHSHVKEGSGIGLALVKKIIELHQGTIRVESNIGKGSTFWIYLPTKQSQETADGK